jgi:hypothetical protein
MLKLGFALSVLFLPIALISTRAQPSPPDRGTAVVSGIVILNGERSCGVAVQLQNQGSYRRNRYDVTTDENGLFQFTHVAAGKYWITARAPAYISPGDDGWGTSGQSLDVADGEKIENIPIEIKRGGVITGRITDSQGDPVPDEDVNIHRLDNDGKPHPFFQPGSFRPTDDRGVYRLYGLPEGRFLVSVGHENDPPSGPFRPRVFYPNVTGQSEAKVIEVFEESEASGIDITLSDTKQPSGNRERTGDFTLHLVTEDGMGLPYVKFDMIPVAEDGRSISGGGVIDTTDEYGNLRFPHSGSKDEPSFYHVRVSHAKGLAPKHMVNRLVGSELTVTMIKGGAITGTITNAKGEQVTGANLLLVMTRDAQGKPMKGGFGFRTTADDRGIYRFWGLTPGSYVVSTSENLACQFARNGSAHGSIQIYHPSSTRETAAEVIVKSGSEASDIDIRQTAGVIRGQVKHSGALPENAETVVTVTIASSRDQYSREAIADGDGQFVFEYLFPGDYEVRAYVRPKIGRHYIRSRPGIQPLPGFDPSVQLVKVAHGRETTVELIVDPRKMNRAR